MTKGMRIKSLREAARLTQTALAEKIGVSKQTLYKYENDIITNIPSDKIELIARYTRSSPEYIMGWDDDKSDQAVPDPQSKELQTLLASMSGEEKEELLNYINFIISKRQQ